MRAAAMGIPGLGAMLIIAAIALVLGLIALLLARRHPRRDRLGQPREPKEPKPGSARGRPIRDRGKPVGRAPRRTMPDQTDGP